MTLASNISLWMDQLDEPIVPRANLTANISADIAIMGAGYTGLWTAYYLKNQNPNLDIVILEAEFCGYGASGRNGGWLMGELAGQDSLLKHSSSEQKTVAHELIHSIPDEVKRVLELEGIDCDYQKGGVLYVAARYPEQNKRLQSWYQSTAGLGYHEHDHQWLEGQKLSDIINIQSADGAVFSPHCASIQPAKLVRGLANTVERLGVKIYENSPVINWGKGFLTTQHAQVKAKWIVPALEAYGGSLNSSLLPLKKYHLPVQSLIIATEPLSEDTWNSIGLHQGEVFSDYSRQVTYGMRTKDNRMVFGARGSYQFGGAIRKQFELTEAEIQLRQKIMVELFPQLENAVITHSWGGNLSMARKFHPHMLIDQDNGFALCGGYGGEGVGASNLAGRTLADLILNKNTLLTSMPWVHKQTLKHMRKWEPEPIPWIGYRCAVQSFDREDQVLNDTNSPIWMRKLTESIANIMEGLVS